MQNRVWALICSAAAAGLIVSGATTFALAETKPTNKINPGHSLAGNYLAARIAATDKDTESASVFYRKAMALDRDNIELKQRAFQTFIANGDFDEGVTLGEELAKSGQAPEMVRIILGVDHIRSKAWSSAEKELSHEWRSALDRLVAGLILGWTQAGNGDGEKALKTVDALSGPAWFDLFVQYHSGLLALHKGDSAGGIMRLEKAFANKAAGQAANFTYMRVVQSLARAYWKDGKADKALDMVSQAIRLQPQNPVFEAMKADIESGKGLANPVSTAQLGAAEVFLNLGTAINKDGGEQFARVYLQLANTLSPKSDPIVMQLADLYDQQDLTARATALFETIKPESPYYRIARLEIALNLDGDEKLDEARAILDELVASGPDDLTTHLSYGAVLSRHEKYGEMIPMYQKLIDRIPNPTRLHWSLYYRQAIAYERTKQWPKAEKGFRKALELNPNQPSVLNYLGYSWVDMNMNLEEGLEMIRKAVEIRPNDGYMVDSLGWAYYRLGRFEEAVEDLERAVELRPADPTINDHLGDAYWRMGRKLEATFQWRHALALDPPTPEDVAKIEAKLETGLPDEKPTKKVAKPEKKKPDNG